jgi:hypothetical protein
MAFAGFPRKLEVYPADGGREDGGAGAKPDVEDLFFRWRDRLDRGNSLLKGVLVSATRRGFGTGRGV